MSNSTRYSGKIVGFMPAKLKKLPTIHKILQYQDKKQPIAINIRLQDPPVLEQAYINYRTALALSKYLRNAKIPLNIGSTIIIDTKLENNVDTVSRVLELNGHKFTGVKSSSSNGTSRRPKSEGNVSSSSNKNASSKVSQASSSSSALSTSRPASTTSKTEASEARKRKAITSSVKDSLSAKSARNRSAAENAGSTASSALSQTASYHSLVATDTHKQASDAYQQLLSVSDSQMHSGLAKAYKKEDWHKFMVDLNTHAGKTFYKSTHLKDTRNRLNFAMRYNNVPTDFKHVYKSHKPKKHYSGDSIKLW